MSIVPEQFKEAVAGAIHRHAMLQPDDRVLVAVSGGPDSVALLDVLGVLGYHLEIAHFDHQTRNGASAADAEFVRQMATDLRVPFHFATAPVEQEAAAAGKSFEQHARDVRYAFFERAAREHGCTAIATAHHADDAAETMLLRIVRGTTPGGLAGIPPVRDLGGVRIVRPLIETSRAHVLAWLEECGLPAREDESNRDTRFLRNRIRQDLLPRLRHDYNPQVGEALRRLAEAARVENEYVHRVAEKAFHRAIDERGALNREFFAGLHEALRRRVVLMFGWRHKVDCPFERVVEAADFIASAPVGRVLDIGCGRQIYNGRTHTEFVDPSAVAADKSEIALAAPGDTEAFGLRFTVRYLDAPPEGAIAPLCSPLRQLFDADTLGGAIVVRHRRDGDRFSPLGLGGTKKLQDYFVDSGVPMPARDVIPLVVAGDKIAWIVGHATSDLTAVRSETRRCVEIEVASCD